MARQEILDQYGLNFVTITVVDWVDVFIRKEYIEVIIDSLQFCQKEKGLLIFCYVIMSNHLHLIVQAGGTIPLTDILRDFYGRLQYRDGLNKRKINGTVMHCIIKNKEGT